MLLHGRGAVFASALCMPGWRHVMPSAVQKATNGKSLGVRCCVDALGVCYAPKWIKHTQLRAQKLYLSKPNQSACETHPHCAKR